MLDDEPKPLDVTQPSDLIGKEPKENLKPPSVNVKPDLLVDASLTLREKIWYRVLPVVLKIGGALLQGTVAGRVMNAVQSLKDAFQPSEGGIMVNDLKGYLVNIIVQWILKIGGGIVLANGISQGSVTEIVGAALGIIIGLVMHLFNTSKAVNATPPGA